MAALFDSVSTPIRRWPIRFASVRRFEPEPLVLLVCQILAGVAYVMATPNIFISFNDSPYLMLATIGFKASFELRQLHFLESKACFGIAIKKVVSSTIP
jgi:hypothetical protein